jgi:hypothetical protein
MFLILPCSPKLLTLITRVRVIKQSGEGFKDKTSISVALCLIDYKDFRIPVPIFYSLSNSNPQYIVLIGAEDS